jgi:hypothetical protein
MGRGGYNGGDPAVNDPKEDNSYIGSAGGTPGFKIPRGFRILKSGEHLKNERGGIQPEFGYLITVEVENHPQKPKGSSRILSAHKRRKGKKSVQSHGWVAASALIRDAPDQVRKYHLQNPEAPKPYGFETTKLELDTPDNDG